MKIKKLIFLSLFTIVSSAFAVEPLENLDLKALRLIPVQSGGRIKPFDEFARETILSLTGSRSFKNFDPSEMLISMMVNPEEWSKVELIRVSNPDVAKQLLLNPAEKYFSPETLMKNNAFLQYAQSIGSDGAEGSQVTNLGVNPVTSQKDPRTEELKRVVGRMTYYQSLLGGHLWKVSPGKEKDAEWGTLTQGMKDPTPSSQAIYLLLKAYSEKNTDSFAENALKAKTTIEGSIPEFSEMSTALTLEVFYNRLRPFLQAMIFYIFAGILWLFAKKHAFPRMMAKFLTFSAIMLHIIGFSLRCYIAGRPPVTNMYESIIWVSLGVVFFALLIFIRSKQLILLSTATFLAGLSLFAADSAPLVMDPTIRPLVPVLRSNYWLTIHVLTITLSYGAFMLAMGIANSSLFQFLKKAKGDESAETTKRITVLNELAYNSLMFGTVLLAAGTILGGVWADYSWGRFWGWDPKEVWALIALLAYMAVLHGRYTGWVTVFSFPLWTVICFSTVVMAWYGVNFVLGVGLHSYGFSNGGQAFVSAFLTIQALYCLYVYFRHRTYLKNK